MSDQENANIEAGIRAIQTFLRDSHQHRTQEDEIERLYDRLNERTLQMEQLAADSRENQELRTENKVLWRLIENHHCSADEAKIKELEQSLKEAWRVAAEQTNLEWDRAETLGQAYSKECTHRSQLETKLYKIKQELLASEANVYTPAVYLANTINKIIGES